MRRWLRRLFVTMGIMVVGFISILVFLQDFKFTKNDKDNPPKFIEADFIDLSKVYSFSKFRSGIGHSTDDSEEKCRSLRHIYGGQESGKYKNAEEKWKSIRFQPDAANSIDIYSPVNGRVVDLSGRRYDNENGVGQTIVIKPDNAPGYKVRMDSIFLDADIKLLMKLKAGQKIGVVCTSCPAEIYVYYSYIKGERAVSYISALSDKVFAGYQARGLKNREDAIISREFRDAHPFTCEDPTNRTSTILNHPEMGDITTSFVILDGYKLLENDKE